MYVPLRSFTSYCEAVWGNELLSKKDVVVLELIDLELCILRFVNL